MGNRSKIFLDRLHIPTLYKRFDNMHQQDLAESALYTTPLAAFDSLISVLWITASEQFK